MVDQLTAMERVANTPIPISCEHVNSLFWFSFLTRHRWNSSQAMRDPLLICTPVNASTRAGMGNDTSRDRRRLYVHGDRRNC